MASPDDVSVIIPAYIASGKLLEYLDRCIASVKGQAHEVVIADDGSPIPLVSFSDPTYRVRVVSGRHIGKSHARNVAADVSNGKLIYPVDADDEIMPSAVRLLTERWIGTPLYSDLIKVNGDEELTFPLTNFDCELMQEKCIASVNVLHSKEQWKYIGGWNEEINLLEDWEYNARLFWMYGATRVTLPLVRYRKHPEQSVNVPVLTKKIASQRVKSMIEDFVGRNEMAGCCGKRTTGIKRGRKMDNPTPAPATAVVTLDLSMEVDLRELGSPEAGKVWARYVGGRGMGPHNRRGMSRTRRKVYNRVRYGDVYQVWAEDAVSEDQFTKGDPNCGFVALRQKSAPPISPPPPKVEVAPQPSVVGRTPVSIVRQPARLSENIGEYKEQMSSMSVSELRNMLQVADLNADDLMVLLEAEQNGQNRVGATKMLQKQIDKLSS